MRKEKKKKENKSGQKLNKSKWTIFGLVLGVVLATVGSVAALNGWFGGGAVIPSDTMTRGLVGYWPLDSGTDQTAYDASGNNNNGTLGANSSVGTDDPQWTAGKAGGALSFDGVNDYVNMGNPASLQLTTAITIEAWLQKDWTSIKTTDERPVHKRESTGKGYGIILNANGNFQFILADGTTGHSIYSAPIYYTTGNAWHHIVCTYDGNKMRMYMDGVIIRTGSTDVFTIDSSADNFYISRSATTWRGLIDEVRIYDRALSAEEVKYHYNRGGPVAQWKFDEGSGATTYDGTDNNNDGTLQNNMATTSWVQGKYSTALSFDGVDDYISTQRTSALDMTGDCTLEMWVYPLSGQSDTYGAAAYQLYQREFYIKSDRRLMLAIRDETAWAYSNVSSAVLTENQWFHVVWISTSVASTTSYKFYIDGKLDSSGTVAKAPMDPGTAYLNIGAYSASADRYKGHIDDVRIYNYARTADEIRLDYNAGFAARFGPQGSCDNDPGSCIDKNLIGYWSMNEGTGTTTYDGSRNNNHGYSTTVATTPAWTTGKVGSGLHFNPNNEILIPDSQSLDWQASKTLTVEMWVKFDNVSFPFCCPPFIGKGTTDTGGNMDFQFWFSNTNKFLMLSLGDGTANQSKYGTKTDWVANQWYQIGFVMDYTAKQVQFYVNGAADGSLQTYTLTGTLPFDNSEPLSIGRGIQCWGNRWLGNIDEVRVYNRALSAAEMRYHYNHGGPVAYWSFNEGNGSTTYDGTDNNNDGTFYLGSLGNTTTSNAWVQGKYSTALSFDGVDDYVSVADSASLDIVNAITIEMWIKHDDLTASKSILSNGTASSKKGYILQENNSERLMLTLGNTTYSTAYTSAGSIPLNTWTHIAITYINSTGQIVFYFNGIGERPQIGLTNITADTKSLEIGAHYATSFFSGLIDDVRIYNYARTADEIKLDYNAGFAARFGYSAASCDNDPGSCMTKGLAGYWSLNEGSGQTIYDGSKYLNNGTLGANSNTGTNDPAWTTGKVGGALSFDGVDDYTTTTDSASLNISNNISIEAWIKPFSYPSGVDPQAYGYPLMRSAPTYYGYRLMLYPSGKIDGAFLNGVNWGSYVQSLTVLSLNTWYHVIYTYDKITHRIYINGVQDNTKADTTGGLSYSGNLYFGSSSGTQRFFNGVVDEIRIYNRVLSAEEIRYHYNRGGPVAYWKFDEGSGSTVYDSTENNNDGTLQSNMATTSWTAGKYGSALSFDGADDNITCGTDASLQLTKNGTVEAWVNLNTRSQSDWPDIVGRISGTDGWELFFGNSDKKFYFGTAKSSTQNYVATNKTDWVVGQWYHITGVLDDTNSLLKIYVDGALDNTKAKTQDAGTGTITCRIGLYGVKYFNGLIDDVRVYNYVRTVDQIKQDYNQGGVLFK